MFKTQLNCAPYVAPSDLKEIQHPVTAFFHSCNKKLISRIFQTEAFTWDGTLSQEAITILQQHAVQGKLTGAEAAMARWLVFAYTHHDLPLDYQVFLPTIGKLQYSLLNNMFHQEEVSTLRK